jgi:hypothetical protein
MNRYVGAIILYRGMIEERRRGGDKERRRGEDKYTYKKRRYYPLFLWV